MRLAALFITCLIGLPLAAPAALAAEAPQKATVGEGEDISLYYLDQARVWRDSGRYELARQAYAQALSTCRNTANMEIIKQELEGVELLIRTMR